MNALLGIHAATGLFGSVIVLLAVSQAAAAAFAVGALLSFMNSLALVFSWPRILAKKQVAWAIGVIVFKFAILGWIIYEVATGNLLSIGWFAVGLGTVIVSVLGTGYTLSLKAES